MAIKDTDTVRNKTTGFPIYRIPIPGTGTGPYTCTARLYGTGGPVRYGVLAMKSSQKSASRRRTALPYRNDSPLP